MSSTVFFGGVAPGTYCDDQQTPNRIRANNDGNCSNDGTISCNGEHAIFKCDQGGLIDLGPTAPGTKCVDGVIEYDD